jgi:serine/threonine protein kinase
MVPLWKEGELVMPIQVDERLLGDEFYLSDFDLAFQAGTSVSQIVRGHGYYQAPEQFHGECPSYATDMWGYMCILAELCFGFILFQPYRRLDRMTVLVETLGPLPTAWKDSYRHGGPWDSSWYDPERKANSFRSLE